MARSRAEELFKCLVDEGEAFIDELIDSEVSEELFLDYKRSGDGGQGPKKLHNDDRKNYAKALSGFGNSAGGVILWGVECKDTPGRGDLPSKKFPLENPARFKSWLEGATSGCTLPPHESVQHHVIPSQDARTGYVATLIPVSSFKPLRCINREKPGYFVRIGSNFRHAPHEVLMGMFGKSPVPDLELDAMVCPIQSLPDGRLEVQFAVRISHASPMLVRDVYVNMWIAGFLVDGEARLMMPLRHGWEITEQNDDTLSLISKPDVRLSPATRMRVANQIFRFEQKDRYSGEIQYGFTYGCAGSQIKSHIIHVHGNEIGPIIAEFASSRPGMEDYSDFCKKLFKLDDWSEMVFSDVDDEFREPWVRSGVVVL